MLVHHTTSTKSDTPQSRLALSLRKSLRNLTATWKSAHTIQEFTRLFQRKRTASKFEDSENWLDEFHLVTPEDIESESPPSPGHPVYTISAHTKTSTKHHPTLSPLIIPDSEITRLSTYTLNSPQKTISSPTPTLAEVAHITASFPQPPTHLPIAIPFPLTTTSACSTRNRLNKIAHSSCRNFVSITCSPRIIFYSYCYFSFRFFFTISCRRYAFYPKHQVPCKRHPSYPKSTFSLEESKIKLLARHNLAFNYTIAFNT